MAIDAEVARTEQAIQAAFRVQDFRAAATLAVENYGAEVCGFLAARLRNPADVGDVFSMFCEDLWSALPNFRWQCSIRGYCYTLARNAANRYSVAPCNRADRRAAFADDEQLSCLIERTRSQTAAHLRTEVKSRMRTLREQLPEDDQTLLILRVERMLPWRELAIVMSENGEPLDASALDQASARMRKRFQLVKDKLKELARLDGLLLED